MTYAYTAGDPMGNSLRGAVEAPTIEDAAQQLRRDGSQVVAIDEADDDSPLFPKRVSKRDIIYLTAQLAIMVETGITLSAALGGIGEQEPNSTLKKILEELRQSVEAGEDFSAALDRYPRLFDKTYCSLVKASEATGTLGAMLDRITSYLRKEVETVARVRAALAYPMVMMVLAIGVTIFLLTYVLPKFLPLFKSRGIALPLPTRVIMTISEVLLGYWYLIVAGAILLAVGFLIGRRTVPGRRTLDWIRIHLPILGPMFRKVIISRSIRTLGTMLGSGVPIMEAIRMAGEVSSNYHYAQAWQRVADEVSGGRRICEVLRGHPLFPRVLVQMIASGEETGKLDSVLERVSNYYDREVETAVKAATSLIEPIMIAIMGVIVGTIGLALLLPVFSLSRQP